MNKRCRHKDCIYIHVCMSFFDLVECSAYKNVGEVPESLKGVGPIDLQSSLIPRNEEYRQ